MATITRFEDIKAWQTARQLANLIYDLTEQKAFVRDYGVKDQIWRAAVSVMSNVAEGFEREILTIRVPHYRRHRHGGQPIFRMAALACTR